MEKRVEKHKVYREEIEFDNKINKQNKINKLEQENYKNRINKISPNILDDIPASTNIMHIKKINTSAEDNDLRQLKMYADLIDEEKGNNINEISKKLIDKNNAFINLYNTDGSINTVLLDTDESYAKYKEIGVLLNNMQTDINKINDNKNIDINTRIKFDENYKFKFENASEITKKTNRSYKKVFRYSWVFSLILVMITLILVIIRVIIY